MVSPAEALSKPYLEQVFDNEVLHRRLGRLARWNSRARILEVGSLSFSMGLVRSLKCEAVVHFVQEDAASEAVRVVSSQGMSDKVEVLAGDLGDIGFGAGDFDGLIGVTRSSQPFPDVLELASQLLAKDGRWIWAVPVKLRSTINKDVETFWSQRLGMDLEGPRELMGLIHENGFEPEYIEVLSLDQIVEHYERLRRFLAVSEQPARSALAKEVELHSNSKNLSGFSMALLMGRRSFPGERPPDSRDRG